MNNSELELIRLGYARKFLDYWDYVPGFKTKYEKNKIETLREYGFPLNPQEYVVNDCGDYLTAYPNSALLMYYDFALDVNARMKSRYKKNIYPQNEKMYQWYKKITEISKEQGIRKVEKSYSTASFELSKGCSVGCPFCGYAAEKLTDIYEDTHENLILFEKCLDIMMEIIGNTVKEGYLYHTSEPLDNPNYEKFSDIFFYKTGRIPQITTAIPFRDVNRTRNILKQVNENGNTCHRFSIMSVQNLFRVYDEFSPEELLYTVIEPRYYEYVKAGKYGRLMDEYSGTISSMVGFVINMCDKTISLRYLCNADALHPTGEVNVCTVNFRDTFEFKESILEIIEKKM